MLPRAGVIGCLFEVVRLFHRVALSLFRVEPLRAFVAGFVETGGSGFVSVDCFTVGVGCIFVGYCGEGMCGMGTGLVCSLARRMCLVLGRRDVVQVHGESAMRMPVGGEAVIDAIGGVFHGLMRVVGCVLSVLCCLDVVPKLGVQARCIAVLCRRSSVLGGCRLMLEGRDIVSHRVVDVAMSRPCIGRIGVLHLENIPCQAMWVTLVMGNWHAFAQRRMSGMGDRSDKHVVASWVGWVEIVHDDVGMGHLAASPELLNRRHVDHITGVDWHRRSLRLINDSNQAQACEADRKVDHVFELI